MRRLKLTAAIAVVAFAAVACTGEPSSVREDRQAAESNLDRLNDAQPVPAFSYSQIRQNLIEINMAQADTTQTTTFFFNQGVATPISSCPSIGFPIPSTAQLTNPWQGTYRNGDGGIAIAQAEQTGIYTGDSTGTYAICVDAQGKAYAFYWEGFVSAVTGPAEWDAVAGQIKLVGPPSFDFSSAKN